MSQEFVENWDRAKALEERGHTAFQNNEYENAAVNHKKAAELFRKVIDFIEVSDEEVRKKTLGNHYIELANYYHSIATFHFYRGEKKEALTNYQRAVEEQKKSIQEYESLKEKKSFLHEINSLKVSLYFYSAYETLCSAQIAFLNEDYSKAIEYFKIAEIHTNLEQEFISEIGDFERVKRAKARFYYIKGQIFRAEALLAIQNSDRKNAKESYLKASELFGDASKLFPEWKEYEDLAKKTKRMAAAIKT